MMNWTGNKFERNDVSKYYLAPGEDVVVRLAIPEGKLLGRVATLVEGAWEKAGMLGLRFPRISAYQGVAIDLE